MIVKQPEERFSTAPEGTFAAVCVDEIDLGRVKTSFNGEDRERNMVRIVWQLDEEDEKGVPFFVKQDYTASLDEKAKLRKHLNSWRGQAFKQHELAGFDLENIVSVGCLLSIVHNTGRKGGVFANVEGVMKLPKGMATPSIRSYVRMKDRAPEEPVSRPQPRPRSVEEQPPDFNQGIDDSDIPF